MTVLITLTIPPGGIAGPFNLYSNTDGFVFPFETNISASALTAGFTSSAVFPGTTTIRVKSISPCANYIDIPINLITTTTTTSSSTSTSTTTSTTTVPPTSTTTSTSSSTSTSTSTSSSTTTSTTTVPPTSTTTSTSSSTSTSTSSTSTSTTSTTAAPTTTTTTTPSTCLQYIINYDGTNAHVVEYLDCIGDPQSVTVDFESPPIIICLTSITSDNYPAYTTADGNCSGGAPTGTCYTYQLTNLVDNGSCPGAVLFEYPLCEAPHTIFPQAVSIGQDPFTFCSWSGGSPAITCGSAKITILNDTCVPTSVEGRISTLTDVTGAGACGFPVPTTCYITNTLGDGTPTLYSRVFLDAGLTTPFPGIEEYYTLANSFPVVAVFGTKINISGQVLDIFTCV